MKRTLTLLALCIVSTALFAEGNDTPVRRTIVVRDGRVVAETNDGTLRYYEFLPGKRAYLGVVLTDLTQELREHYGASKNAGVLVGSVEDNSPADKAGVKVGDIVLSVDGVEVDSSADLRRALANKKDGDTVRLELLRGRSRQSVVATVAEREGPRVIGPHDLDALRGRLDSPEWRARIDTLRPNCADLQSRIKELESRLKELEKKLQR